MPAVHHQKWQPSEFHMGTTLLLHFHAPPLRTLPNQNDAADVPISTFYSAPFELALARSKRGEGRVGAADGGTTGLSSFLRDKIRSYHIVWAPEGPETRQCPPNSGEEEFPIQSVLNLIAKTRSLKRTVHPVTPVVCLGPSCDKAP